MADVTPNYALEYEKAELERMRLEVSLKASRVQRLEKEDEIQRLEKNAEATRETLAQVVEKIAQLAHHRPIGREEE